jgi:WD40 repeat protein
MTEERLLHFLIALECHSDSIVVSVAVGERQGRTVIVSGSADNTVRVWDLETLQPVGAPLEGHSSYVNSVAVGQRQGRAVIVSGSKDSTVRVWDLETVQPVGAAQLEGDAESVAVGRAAGPRGDRVRQSGQYRAGVRSGDAAVPVLSGNRNVRHERSLC